MKEVTFKPPVLSEYALDRMTQKYLQHVDPKVVPKFLKILQDINDSKILNVGFKKTHPNAKLPLRKNATDTGYDIFSVENKTISSKSDAVIETGIEIANVPPGYWYLILPRSGMGFLHGIQPHLGVIDNGYRGSLAVKLYNFSDKEYNIKEGDRIAQIAFFPLVQIEPQWSEQTSTTDRGNNGFGSSGK